MADEADQAQVLNEDFQAYVLEQNKNNREPGNYSGIDCIDCGDEIPEKRRIAQPGCRRCIDCQNDFESDHRRGM
jgi:phage/conjugal plasmid C-4 type zinc finger TraR family protein